MLCSGTVIVAIKEKRITFTKVFSLLGHLHFTGLLPFYATYTTFQSKTFLIYCIHLTALMSYFTNNSLHRR